MRLAVIPARGGSKRIPRKNIKPFAGKPMIAWAIKIALQSGCFDRVIVSTEDVEISSVARCFGAEVPFVRPAHLADDHSTTQAVIAHAIEAVGGDVGAVCCIYPTAALLEPEDLRRGLEVLERGASYVLAASPLPSPAQQTFTLSEWGGTVEAFWPEHQFTRTQDLPPSYYDAGQFYWGQARAWLTGVPIFGGKTRAVIIPRWRAIDIDTMDDWEHAETLAEMKRPAGAGQ